MYEQLLKSHSLAEVLAFAASRAVWTEEEEESAPLESTRPTVLSPDAATIAPAARRDRCTFAGTVRAPNAHGGSLFNQVG